MLLKDAQVKIDRMLERITSTFENVYPSKFLPLPSQPGILVDRLEICVEVVVDKFELNDKTDDEIREFLRQRILDNITTTINPLCDELEGK